MATTVHKAHVAPWKRQEVQDLVQLIKEHNVIAIVSVGGIPAAQMASMRASLRDECTIRVTKNTLLTLALEQVGKETAGIAELVEKMEGQTAVIATDMNPFKLYKKLEATKTKAPAKGGDIAPEDIKVEKGDTPFKPGPVVGDLQKAGIPAKIDQGKVVIASDKLLVKAGDPIPDDTAKMLTRLEIFPMTVGLDLRAAYEDGTVFETDVLAVDEEAMLARLKAAAAGGFNVAVYTAWTTPLTIVPLLAKAHREAVSAGVEAAFPEKGTVELLISKAYAQGLAIARNASAEALDEDLQTTLTAAPAAAPAAAEAPAEEAKEEEKEEEEASEEDAAAGLGALFG